MSNSFKEAQETERELMPLVLPFLEKLFDRILDTNKSNGDLMQKKIGDFIGIKDGHLFRLEVKNDKTDYGNFFLETWSNRKRFTLGWMFTCPSEYLFYFFNQYQSIYMFKMTELKKWAFIDMNIYRYPEKKQGKFNQLNDTWGRCVPILQLKPIAKLVEQATK